MLEFGPAHEPLANVVLKQALHHSHHNFGIGRGEESQSWINALVAVLKAHTTGNATLLENCASALAHATSAGTNSPLAPLHHERKERRKYHADGYYDNRLNSTATDPTVTADLIRRQELQRSHVLAAGGVEAVISAMRVYPNSYCLAVDGCSVLHNVAHTHRAGQAGDTPEKLAVCAAGGAEAAVCVLDTWGGMSKDFHAAIHAATGVLISLAASSKPGATIGKRAVQRAGGARACGAISRLHHHSPDLLWTCFSVFSKLACGDPESQQAVREVGAAGLAATAMQHHPHRADLVEYCHRLFTSLSQIPLASLRDDLKDDGLAYACDIVDAGGPALILAAMRRHRRQVGIETFGLQALGNLAACNDSCCAAVLGSGAVPFITSILLGKANADVGKRAMLALYNLVARDTTGKAKETALAVGAKLEWFDGIKTEMCKGTIESVGVSARTNRRVDQSEETAYFKGAEEPRLEEDVAFEDIPLGKVLDDMAITSDSEYHRLFSAAGSLMLQSQFEEAIDILQGAVALCPNRPLAFSMLGAALQKSGDMEGAAHAYTQAMERSEEGSGQWANNVADAFNVLRTVNLTPKWWNDQSLKEISTKVMTHVKPSDGDVLMVLMRAEVLAGLSNRWDAGPRNADELREAGKYFQWAAKRLPSRQCKEDAVRKALECARLAVRAAPN